MKLLSIITLFPSLIIIGWLVGWRMYVTLPAQVLGAAMGVAAAALVMYVVRLIAGEEAWDA